MTDDSTGAGVARVTAPAPSGSAAKVSLVDPRTSGVRPNAGPAPVQPVRIASRHELTDDDLRDIMKKVGRPWYHRRKVIPVWKIRALRNAGFSYRQVGKVYDVSASTIKRRLREARDTESAHHRK